MPPAIILRLDLHQGPVTRERELTFLVQLLHDSAYAVIPLHQKLHQLQQLLLTELVRLEVSLRTAKERPPADWAGNAIQLGAIVLPTEVHFRALDVLRQRRP